MISRLAIVASTMLLATAAIGQSTNDATKARDEIWAKEMKIYAGRAKGEVSYYEANASVDFLAWTYGTPKPFRRDNFKTQGKALAKQDHEKITTELKDFSLHGNTAIIYYVNHRTVMPDGTPVDQSFDNIHVWTQEDGTWKVLASMSRLETTK